MAEIKISEMTPATTMAGDELVPIVQGGNNKFATQDLLKSLKVDDVAPTAENGSLWFNPATGKLYVKVDGDWVDVTELTISNTTQYHAVDIIFVPQGDISAVDVQAAIVELDTEKKSSTYKGAYNAEIVASPTTGTLTLKNSTETVLETALTNSNAFTVAMPTPTAGQVNESVLIFSIGATLPTITQPVGIVWRGTAPTLAINKTYTIAYESINTTGSTFVLYAVGVQNA